VLLKVSNCSNVYRLFLQTTASINRLTVCPLAVRWTGGTQWHNEDPRDLHFPNCMISYTMEGSAMQHNTVLWLARLKDRAATGRSINSAAGAVCGVVRFHEGAHYFQKSQRCYGTR